MTIPLLTQYNNKLIPIDELNKIRSTGNYETRNISYEPENWKNIKLENIKPENSKIINSNEYLSNTQTFNQKVLKLYGDPLLQLFFSEDNISYIKSRVKSEIYKLIKEHINTDNDDSALNNLMNGIYKTAREGKMPLYYCNTQCNVKNALIVLNQSVISKYVINVVNNVNMFKYYLKDKMTLPTPLQLPRNVSLSGGNTLALQTGFESTKELNQKIKNFNIFNT